MAYEMTTLPGGGGGGVDDHEYEVIGRGRGNTSGPVTQGDGIYSIPDDVTQHPHPHAPLPLTKTTPTDVDVANKGKNTAGDGYYNIAVIPAK